MSALQVDALHISRSGLPVIRGVKLRVEPGQISVLLGANGAGKTTLLEGISGLIAAEGGGVTLDGHAILNLRPASRARHGLAHVEQGRTVFARLTTEENLKLVGRSVDPAEAYTLFPELEKRRTVRAGLLSGGEQQMLVIARALAARPKVMMIDEMSAGLAPIVVSRLMGAARLLADRGLSILLVEQFAALALKIGDRAYVLRKGTVVYDGDCSTLIQDPDLLHALYLGQGGSA